MTKAERKRMFLDAALTVEDRKRRAGVVQLQVAEERRMAGGNAPALPRKAPAPKKPPAAKASKKKKKKTEGDDGEEKKPKKERVLAPTHFYGFTGGGASSACNRRTRRRSGERCKIMNALFRFRYSNVHTSPSPTHSTNPTPGTTGHVLPPLVENYRGLLQKFNTGGKVRTNRRPPLPHLQPVTLFR